MGHLLADAHRNALALDGAQVADTYSQLTGVIAGFAFSSIVVLLAYRVGRDGHDRPPDGHLQNALLLFFSCFMGMTTSSLAYSMLSGMKEHQETLEVGHVVAGTGFGVASLMGLLGIHQLVLQCGFRIEREIGIVSGSLAPLLTISYQVVGLLQIDKRAGGIFGGCAVLATLAVASVAPHLKRHDAGAEPGPPASYSTLALISLGVSSTPSLVVSALATTGVGAHFPAWPAYTAIVVSFLMYSWVMLKFQHVREA